NILAQLEKNYIDIRKIIVEHRDENSFTKKEKSESQSELQHKTTDDLISSKQALDQKRKEIVEELLTKEKSENNEVIKNLLLLYKSFSEKRLSRQRIENHIKGGNLQHSELQDFKKAEEEAKDKLVEYAKRYIKEIDIEAKLIGYNLTLEKELHIVHKHMISEISSFVSKKCENLSKDVRKVEDPKKKKNDKPKPDPENNLE